MPIMEITIIPLGTQTASLSEYVADSVVVLKQEKDIMYHLTAMGTIVQADSISKLFDVAKKMHKAVLKKSKRVVTAIKIDDRKDKRITVQSKLQSVQKHLNNKLIKKRILSGRGE